MEQTIASIIGEEEVKAQPIEEKQMDHNENVEEKKSFKWNFGFFSNPTGEGPVENYSEHVLNFDGRKSTARGVRALTGVIGSDIGNSWPMDLAVALVERLEENRVAKHEEPV